MNLYRVISWLCKLGEHHNCETKDCNCYCHKTTIPYCCNMFKSWVTSGVDEYLGFDNDKNRFTVTVKHWGDNQPISFCPFCGKELL